MSHSEERKRNISKSMKNFFQEHPEEKGSSFKGMSEEQKSLRAKKSAATKAKGRTEPALTTFSGQPLENILQLSQRTITKILRRLDVGCSQCGWKEGSCDIHHIRGRKIENCDHHSNLTHVCPNCHRLAHEGKIAPENLITLEQQLGETWKHFYFT